MCVPFRGEKHPALQWPPPLQYTRTPPPQAQVRTGELPGSTSLLVAAFTKSAINATFPSDPAA